MLTNASITLVKAFKRKLIMKICVINVSKIKIFDFFIKLFILLESLESVRCNNLFFARFILLFIYLCICVLVCINCLGVHFGWD